MIVIYIFVEYKIPAEPAFLIMLSIYRGEGVDEYYPIMLSINSLGHHNLIKKNIKLKPI